MDSPLVQQLRTANTALIVDGNLDTIGEFFTPDYVAHFTDRDMTGGHAAIRKFLVMVRTAFPDVKVKVEVLLEGKTRIAWQRTLTGTHQANFAGFPPTGRRVMWRDMITSEFRGGLIAEEWAISDLAEQLLHARKR